MDATSPYHHIHTLNVNEYRNDIAVVSKCLDHTLVVHWCGRLLLLVSDKHAHWHKNTVSNETCDKLDVFPGKACLYETQMKTDLSHWNCRSVANGNLLRLKMCVLMADGPCPEWAVQIAYQCEGHIMNN